MRAHVVCPVCRKTLEFEQVGELWGMIPIAHTACMEVTIGDPTGVVSDHIREHQADGTHWSKLREFYDSMARARRNMAARYDWPDLD